LANTVLLDESGAPRPGGNGLPELVSVVVRRDYILLQRVWRDLNVLTQHLYLRETTHTTAGKIALGLDVVAPQL
jgi:hypothetical protein